MYAVISISTVERKLSEQHIRLSEQGSFLYSQFHLICPQGCG